MKEQILSTFKNDYTRFYEKYLTKIKKLKDSEYQALCSLHDDTEPSFNFNSQTGQYFCHGCKKGGDIFSFYAELNHLDSKTDFQKTYRSKIYILFYPTPYEKVWVDLIAPPPSDSYQGSRNPSLNPLSVLRSL